MRRRRTRKQTRLVDVLITMGVVDQAIVRQAAAEFYERKFGEWLVEQGLITDDALTFALARQAVDSGRFEAANQQLAAASAKLHEKLLKHFDGIGGVMSRLADFGRTR